MRVRLLSYTPLEPLMEALPGTRPRDLLPHMGYVFAVEGVSRACSHQLVRHRVASFSQQSQRYITVKRLGERVVEPPSMAGRREFLDVVKAVQEAYESLIASGVSKEDARFLLPNATETSLLMTMDGGSLLHFLGLRLCYRAQWEIRALAKEALRELRKAQPTLFREAGPYCLQLGYCPEGRFNCGRMKEAWEEFRAEP